MKFGHMILFLIVPQGSQPSRSGCPAGFVSRAHLAFDFRSETSGSAALSSQSVFAQTLKCPQGRGTGHSHALLNQLHKINWKIPFGKVLFLFLDFKINRHERSQLNLD